MLCKIADFYVEIKYTYAETAAFLKSYACGEMRKADFVLEATEGEMIAEEKAFAKANGDKEYLMTYIERAVLLRQFCDKIVAHDAFLMHGALIEYEGKGYLFTAKSGVGKTTHIRLWQERFGADNVKIINGDKPIIRIIDGEIYAYGTPWCGKEKYNINTRTLLKKICFIERDTENSIAKISDGEAVPRLLSQIDLSGTKALGSLLSMLDVLVDKVEMYRLLCNKDISAASVAYNGMKKGN